MNEQEIEMMERLIDMLGGAGEGAFWLGMAWVGKGYFTSVLIAATVILVAVILAKVIKYLVCYLNEWNALRSHAGVPHAWGMVTNSERNRVYEMIRKGLEAEMNERSGGQ